MHRIAHLSDVHLLDPRRDPRSRRAGARYRLATKLVSLGRSLDPRLRARKLARALAAAKASLASHVVISGDLTELGDDAEFEHFAEILEDAALDPDAVTIVPGNHDAYTTAGGWRRALEGPLRRFAATSAGHAGKVVDRGPVAFLPIDTSCYQSLVRAGGEFSRDAAKAIEARLGDPALRDKAVVLVLHHSPLGQDRPRWMRWVDGLRGERQVVDLLHRHPRLSVLHGHLHRVVDRILSGREATPTRVFGAPAVCDDADDPGEFRPKVRLYEVTGAALASVGLI